VTTLRAIGLMSGTSLDGVDVALIETDGERIEQLGPTGYRAYAPEERELLRSALADAGKIVNRGDRAGNLSEAEALVTRAHAEAVERFVREQRVSAVDVIGFHGQTVLHRPKERLTVQIGDGGALARRLNVPVVFDFRAADVAAGGQGAPLVPIFHRALVERTRIEPPVAVLNIGGVANVTFVAANGSLLAFDTGPGNALIDDWMGERTGQPLDQDGGVAARGAPDEVLLTWLLSHPFFRSRPPKSLDRNWFSHRVVGDQTTEDGAATLTAFTARAVARALDYTSEPPRRWIVAGGGAKNGELLRLLKHHTGAEIVTADAVGWSSADIEAQAFGYLAVRSLRGLPITFPSTTGVKEPMTGGTTARP
jgi:anhydro-N-acetylmuramic acid kinase